MWWIMPEQIEIHEVNGKVFAIRKLRILGTTFNSKDSVMEIKYETAGDHALAQKYVEDQLNAILKKIEGQWAGVEKNA